MHNKAYIITGGITEDHVRSLQDLWVSDLRSIIRMGRHYKRTIQGIVVFFPSEMAANDYARVNHSFQGYWFEWIKEIK